MDPKKKIEELRQKKAEFVEKMKGLVAASEEARQNPTAEQLAEFAGWEAECDAIDAQIRRIESIAKHGREIEQVDRRFTPPSGTRTEPTGIPAFANLGEFMYTLRTNPHDPRLQTVGREQRVQVMGQGSLGGFALPDQFRPEILMIDPQGSIVRPRATVIPAGDPPDSSISMPALNQKGANNTYGGVRVYHTEEDAAATESNLKLDKVTLQPKKLMGYITASNELLANWAASAAFFATMMRRAMLGQEDYDFLRGSGVNQAQGVVGSAAAIAYNRATANQISFNDVVGMLARMKYGGNLVWLASQTTIPQLANIRDTGNFNLWMTGAVNGLPTTLGGFPLYYVDRLPALGTKGDIGLYDLSYYLIKDGSGPYVAQSEHFRFQNDETVFRITWHVDGRPWLTAPFPLEGASTSTVSPFVVLDTP